MRTRRELVIGMAAGVATAQVWAGNLDTHASGQDLDTHAKDWNWLVGTWDVWHRQLKERLAGSNDWQEFGGKSALWLSMNGFGTIDDNIIERPGNTYRGLTIRAFDPGRRHWSIWWRMDAIRRA